MCRHFDTIPACDGRTDGIAVASTALAMRHAVKIDLIYQPQKSLYTQFTSAASKMVRCSQLKCEVHTCQLFLTLNTVFHILDPI